MLFAHFKNRSNPETSNLQLRRQIVLQPDLLDLSQLSGIELDVVLGVADQRPEDIVSLPVLLLFVGFRSVLGAATSLEEEGSRGQFFKIRRGPEDHRYSQGHDRRCTQDLR